jgi:hypothetical protein
VLFHQYQVAQNTRSRPELAGRVPPKSGKFRASKIKNGGDYMATLAAEAGVTSETEALEKLPGARLQNLHFSSIRREQRDDYIQGKFSLLGSGGTWVRMLGSSQNSSPSTPLPVSQATRERTGVKRERRLTAERGGSRNGTANSTRSFLLLQPRTPGSVKRGHEGPKEG